jgi:hypothetical protein|tara:strand:+ start:7761 stop:7910 length:150 start_codon:yes stop_codon:yes gene_type:complete
MKNLNSFKNYQLAPKLKQTVFGGNADDGITNGNCTPDPLGDAIRNGLGL